MICVAFVKLWCMFKMPLQFLGGGQNCSWISNLPINFARADRDIYGIFSGTFSFIPFMLHSLTQSSLLAVKQKMSTKLLHPGRHTWTSEACVHVCVAWILYVLGCQPNAQPFSFPILGLGPDRSVGRLSGLTPGCHLVWYRLEWLFDTCFKI